VTTPEEPPQGDPVPPAPTGSDAPTTDGGPAAPGTDGTDGDSAVPDTHGDSPAAGTDSNPGTPGKDGAPAADDGSPAPDPAGGSPASGPAGDPSASAPEGDSSASHPESGSPAAEADEAEGAPGPPGAPDSASHPRGRRWLKIAAVCTALLVLVCAGTGWYLYQRLNGNITTDTATENDLRVHASERPAEGPTKAENILLIGSDNRGNGNGKYGRDSGTQRSDTTILLHLAADRKSATAVSIPRDLMAHVPSCTLSDGTEDRERFEQFNWAFEAGGAACTIRTVEKMTGIRIDHHLIVDFNGFKNMVNAVHGVEVCVAEPVHDTYAHLDLPAGRQTLNGEQALGYVRARHGIGDGSDTMRMDRQQAFLGSLLKKVRSNGVLLNPTKLYPLLSAATSSLTADPGLDSLSELYSLTHSLQRIPTGAVRFLTVPQEPYVNDSNRDQLLQPGADTLFTRLRNDQPVNVSDKGSDGGGDSGDSDSGSTPTPGTPSAGASATPTPSGPTYRGTTADRDICGKNG
jgi:LCP family protein required for cell wall assembly